LSASGWIAVMSRTVAATRSPPFKCRLCPDAAEATRCTGDEPGFERH
jgi:hypothetical protein